MADAGFARYTYRSSRNRLPAGGGLAIAAVALVLLTVNLTPWVLVLLVVPLVIVVRLARAGSRNVLIIGSRYLIVGDDICYYRNVERVELDRGRHTLTLITGRGRRVTISADHFPTNARKPDKIRLNTVAKFEKATAKLCQRLKEVVPDVVD